MTNTEKIFVECVRCGILGEKIASMPEGVDLRELYRLTMAHSMSAAVNAALGGLADSLPGGFTAALARSAQKHVVRDVRSRYDINTVLTAMETRGLRFMPLKGYHLKELYPSSEMRYASDCDVLFDAGQLKEVRALFTELGLSVEHFDEHHDVYYYPATKTVFEMHKSIFVGPLHQYFGTGFERAHLREGYKSFYELSPEDFYITILAHSAYHFAHGGGVGIRHLSDIFLYKRANNLDYEYLDRELSTCGLYEFKNQFERLSEYFFSSAEADDFTLCLAEHVLSSTILANEEKQHASDIAANSDGNSESAARSKTVWRKFFPTKENMLFAYPVLKKAPIFYPLFYPVRWIQLLFTRPGSLKRVADISAADSSDIAKMRHIRDGLGLDKI